MGSEVPLPDQVSSAVSEMGAAAGLGLVDLVGNHGLGRNVGHKIRKT